MKKKLAVIGIDGGTFDIIRPLYEKGLLPNLKSLEKQDILDSVIPPVTAPAWASFLTGNLPGKTEIYDFTIVDNNSWKVNFINRKRMKGKPIWEFLDEANLKSCFINSPLTYPPAKINGVMISGIETPSKMHQYTYPPEIKDKLNEMNYEIEVSPLKEREEIVKQAIDILDKRIKAAEYFFAQDFDFFFVLFRASDIVQHYSWGKEEIEIVYQKIDDFIGKIKDKTDVIVISDHGFERIDKAFNANAWLSNEGYLKTSFKKSKLSYLGISKERIYKIINAFNLQFLIRMIPRSLGKKIPSSEIDFETAIVSGIVDMNNTKVIAKRAVKCAQFFINSEKRGGIVNTQEEILLKQELKSKLETFLKNAGLKFFVKTKEELYGKDSIYAPDLTLFLEEKGYDTHCFLSPSKEVWVNSIAGQDAEHNYHGIIMSNLQLTNKNKRIIDLVPTILSYFKIRKGNFDGKSLL
jgi:predicted AlkP superfamily phosphohydrolase/phosphomutase